ncbi:MAG: lysylphosphatidylglycerol synthase transmembrane domain-containing protein [Flavobacteriales bacterium]
MGRTVIGAIKVLVPLALGVWLITYFYQQLSLPQRAQLFAAFGQAQWGWLLLGLLLSFLSHLARAWRWRYLLEPLGHRIPLFMTYNATMSGYFMNLLLPRAGEATRAALLARRGGVPFEQGLGTIFAERAVDLLLLGIIAFVTVVLQLDKLDVFLSRIATFRNSQGGADTTDLERVLWLLAAALFVGLAAGLYLVRSRPAWRSRLRRSFNGLLDGMRSVLRTRHRAAFIGHSVLIWVLYVAMFWVGFLALPSTAVLPPAAVLAGFVAGTLGVVLVQGGVGVYPAFVAIILSVYMPAPLEGGLLHPEALALGWLLWVAQTLLVIILGGLSLLLMAPTPRQHGA